MSIEIHDLLNVFGFRKRWLGRRVYWVYNGEVKSGKIESVGISVKTVFVHVFSEGVGMIYPPLPAELYETEYEANQACIQSHLDVVTGLRDKNTKLLKEMNDAN